MPWHSPEKTFSETSISAFVSPKALETFSASPTGAGLSTGPVDELLCIRRGFSTYELLVVPPQVSAVLLRRTVGTGERYQWRRQCVLEVAGHRHDLAVVVGSLTVAVLGALGRLLRVVDGVIGVLVGGLVDRRVEVLAPDHIALVRRSNLADQDAGGVRPDH